jgi:two-component system OmpR family response regulator
VTGNGSGRGRPPRVLVVDDELNIRELVGTALRYEGFDITTAQDGRSALRAIEEQRPDLVVLDVSMPDLDGFELTRRLRRDGVDVPIVFLTARDDTEHKVTGLRLGADDYVTKPFSLEELAERVRAVLRRTANGTSDTVLEFADLQLDDDAHEVRRADQAVSLTPTEYRLLRYFMLNPRRVLSKQQILEHVWDYDFGGDGNVVETFMSYLRKKVDCVEPALLHTVRGAGYVLRLPDR